VLDVAGRSITVAVTHLGLDDESRRLQIDAILGALARSQTLALMGDFNYRPTSAPHATVVDAGWRDAWAEAGSGDGFTHPASDPGTRIDFIYLGEPAASPACIEVPLLGVSDHLPVVATLPAMP
jgi:endonuclease/exonuclease/phosphatase family metal-dependent hydrolase